MPQTTKEMIQQALDIAYSYHQFQIDKAGMPYMKHVISVAILACLHGENPEETVHLFARGLLHDVLKDTELTEEKLREIYPFPEVCDTVVILTRKKDEMYMNRTVRKGRLE